MSATGVSLQDEAVAAFNIFKKEGNKSKYMIFVVQDKKTIMVEKESDSDDFEEFMGHLPENDGRYAVYKVDLKSTDGRDMNKLCFISW